MSDKKGKKQNKEEDKLFLLKCIEVYKSFPALWKIQSSDYKNRDKKFHAYAELLKIYRQKYSTADREEVKNKFNILRTNFRKELKKVRDSKRSGAGQEDVYESTAWYFKDMQFLTDQEEPDDSINIIADEEEETNITCEESSRNSSTQDDDSAPRCKKRNIQSNQNQFLQLACERLRAPQDDFNQLGITWANELKKMDPGQQIFAKKFINDILFEGQTGSLHRRAVVINGSSQEPISPYYTISVAPV